MNSAQRLTRLERLREMEHRAARVEVMRLRALLAQADGALQVAVGDVSAARDEAATRLREGGEQAWMMSCAALELAQQSFAGHVSRRMPVEQAAAIAAELEAETRRGWEQMKKLRELSAAEARVELLRSEQAALDEGSRLLRHHKSWFATH